MKRKSTDPLASAVAEWQAGERLSTEELSPTTRTKIVASARSERERGTAPAPLATLFFPVRQFALAGALPLLLLTLALGYLTLDGTGLSSGSAVSGPAIQASKTGDQVVFIIANGQRAHRVYKSSVPNRFDEGAPHVTTDGAYRDRLDTGPDLVFYRID